MAAAEPLEARTTNRPVEPPTDAPAAEGSAPCDDEARPFSEFYGAERDRVARALALTVRNTALGSEAADEAMARAYLAWPTVRRATNPTGWVYRVGLNWARSLLRRRTREALGVDVADLARRDDHVDVDLERAIARLGVDHRAVVVARHLLGMSTAETATALEISEGTVKSRLSRALDQLRTDLERSR